MSLSRGQCCLSSSSNAASLPGFTRYVTMTGRTATSWLRQELNVIGRTLLSSSRSSHPLRRRNAEQLKPQVEHRADASAEQQSRVPHRGLALQHGMQVVESA